MTNVDEERIDENVLVNFSTLFEYAKDFQFELLKALENDSANLDDEQRDRLDAYKTFVMEF